MKVYILVTALLCYVFAANGQEVIAAKALTFKGIFATRQCDKREYILLGGGWLRTIRSGSPEEFIAKWLTSHPTAIARPISRKVNTNTRTKIGEQVVYIWVEDQNGCLNVDLVRAGVFPGGVMIDQVENWRAMLESLKDPRLRSAMEEVAKERAEMPQDEPERLVSESEYIQRRRRVEDAEVQARSEKLGIWSDAMKEEREADGYP